MSDELEISGAAKYILPYVEENAIIGFNHDLQDLVVGRIVFSCTGTPGIIFEVSVNGRYPIVGFLWISGKISEHNFIQWHKTIDSERTEYIKFTNKYLILAELEIVSNIIYLRQTSDPLNVEGKSFKKFIDIVNSKL